MKGREKERKGKERGHRGGPLVLSTFDNF